MHRKPWPIIIISIIFFIIPIANIVNTFYYFKTNYSFVDYVYSLLNLSANYMPLFDMIIPSLIAGISVYSVKKWSYPLFLACMLWITLKILLYLPSDWKLGDLMFVLVLPMTVNIILVSYFLLPAVRIVYFDPRLRWWESKPRFIYSGDIAIKLNEENIIGKISNISEGGLFVLLTSLIPSETVIDTEFEVLNSKIQLKAKVVYHKPDNISHGLQFIEMTKQQKKLLKKIIQTLVKEKYVEIRPAPIWTEDFAEWFLTIIAKIKQFFLKSKNNN